MLISIARPLGILVAVFALWSTPWPYSRAWFARATAEATNVVFANTTFGRGHFQLVPTHPNATSTPSGLMTYDAALVLSAEGHEGTLEVGMNIRRDLYLPLGMACAVLCALAMSWSQRVVLTLTAACTTWLFWCGLVYVTALFNFSQLTLVYPVADAHRRALDILISVLLAPPLNRLLLPVLLAVALAWLSGIAPTLERRAEVSPCDLT